MKPEYLSRVLSDSFGIMARAGHHCAHPLHDVLGAVDGTLRLSLQLYNTVEEVTHIADALRSLI